MAAAACAGHNAGTEHMDSAYRRLVNLGLTLFIVLLAGLVLWHFLLPLAWAAVIALASWPLFERIRAGLRGRNTLAAAVTTLLVSVVLIGPLGWLMLLLGQELHRLADFLAATNAQGLPAPVWLAHLPWFGAEAQRLWSEVLSQPQGLSHYLQSALAGRVAFLSNWLRDLSLQIGHRLLIFAFMLLSLFFFYRDGPQLIRQSDAVGARWLGPRWALYAGTIPGAVRATVNGLVLVGLAEGFLLGIAYALAGVASPVLWGFVTAILAVIPFGAPLAFTGVALALLVQGSALTALLIFGWGMLVVFVADHFVRPLIIGGATRLPFLLVLFGILGGVESMGLVGLFLGPVLMVLLATLWREAAAGSA